MSIPLAQGVGVVELSTETTEETVTIRIGDATATVNRLDLVDAISTRLAPALLPYNPDGFGGGPVLGAGIGRVRPR